MSNNYGFKSIADYYKKGDNALIAIEDVESGHYISTSAGDIENILFQQLKLFIENQFSNFDGIQYDCIDFYRNKINNLLDDLEND